jgi:electron transfer flavoprotein beta subunit
MNIIVCLNFLPDVNIIRLDTQNGGQIDTEDLVYRVHPSDLVAVETAVRIKEENGSGKVLLFSMASPSGERLLRRCLAMGADEGILMDDPGFKNLDGYSTGVILAKGSRTVDFDLILCGHGALEGLGGQTGYVIAELLSLPIVSRVTRIDIFPERNELAIEKKLEKGYRERMEIPLPAVLTLEESLNEPRYASLPNMLYAQEKEIMTMSREDLNVSPEETEVNEPKTELIHMVTPKPRPKKIFTPDPSLSAEDRMWQIMSGGLDEKNREVFEGSPADLSLKFIEYLNQLGIDWGLGKGESGESKEL